MAAGHEGKPTDQNLQALAEQQEGNHGEAAEEKEEEGKTLRLQDICHLGSYQTSVQVAIIEWPWF